MAVIDKLLQSATNHAEDSGEPDHEVGDLQDVLREAWALLSPDQRRTLLAGDAVANLIEAGSRDEFTAEDLEAELAGE